MLRGDRLFESLPRASQLLTPKQPARGGGLDGLVEEPRPEVGFDPVKDRPVRRHDRNALV